MNSQTNIHANIFDSTVIVASVWFLRSKSQDELDKKTNNHLPLPMDYASNEGMMSLFIHAILVLKKVLLKKYKQVQHEKKNIFEKFTSSIVFAHLQCKLVHRYPVSHNAQNRHFTQYISDNFCFLLSIYNKFQLINSKFYASILFVYLSEFVSKRVIGNIMSIMQPNSHIMTKSIKTTNQLKM